MSTKVRILIIVILALTVTFVSCGKKHELKRLTGSWKLVYGPFNTIPNIWTFDADQILLRDFNDTITQRDTASYELIGEFMNGYYLDINDMSQYIDGHYKILKLNKEFFTIERISTSEGSGGAYHRLEFKRAD